MQKPNGNSETDKIVNLLYSMSYLSADILEKIWAELQNFQEPDKNSKFPWTDRTSIIDFNF